uniref:C-type lectin domain-containing protein n=1 Tax=Acrobeloides nanus TaxID=290746 RepID=A0A914E306_9BILA
MRCYLIFVFIVTLEAYVIANHLQPNVGDSCHNNGGNLGPDNQCYGFYQSDEFDGSTWKQAQEFCRQQGGDMASIKNAFVNAFLYSFLANNTSPFLWGNQDAWIGLIANITNTTCSWVWTDGSRPSYTNWENLNPTNNCFFNNTVVGDQAAYMSYEDGKWSFGSAMGQAEFFFCAF